MFNSTAESRTAVKVAYNVMEFSSCDLQNIQDVFNRASIDISYLLPYYCLKFLYLLPFSSLSFLVSTLRKSSFFKVKIRLLKVYNIYYNNNNKYIR